MANLTDRPVKSVTLGSHNPLIVKLKPITAAIDEVMYGLPPGALVPSGKAASQSDRDIRSAIAECLRKQFVSAIKGWIEAEKAGADSLASGQGQAAGLSLTAGGDAASTERQGKGGRAKPKVAENAQRSNPVPGPVPGPGLTPLPFPSDWALELKLPVISVVTLFRQYFVPSGEVLGHAEQAFTIGPYETVEVIQQTTRRTTFEESQESSASIDEERSTESRVTDEITDRVQDSIERTRTDATSFSASASGSYGIVSGSANYSQSNSLTDVRKSSQEQTSKHLTELTKRASEKLTKTFTVKTKTTRDFTESNSYRRLVENKTAKPVNYVLRRLHNRFTVKIQDLGPRLCWQTEIKDPGRQLGRSRFLPSVLAPDYDFGLSFGAGQQPFSLPKKTIKVNATLPTGESLDWVLPLQSFSALPQITFLNQKLHKIISVDAEVNGEMRTNRFQVFIETVQSTVLDPSPQIPSNHVAVYVGLAIFPDPTNVETGKPVNLLIDGVVGWHSSPMGGFNGMNDEYLAKIEHWLGKQREILQARDGIRKRPSNDLRREERHELLRLVRSEVLGFDESLPLSPEEIEGFSKFFEIEAMFHFVHPSWALPATYSGYSYEVVEGAQPRPFGASLGWLLQLDADDRRNELLNSPLARVCIPIRPGYEKFAALYLAQKGQLSGDVSDLERLLKEIEEVRLKQDALKENGPDDLLETNLQDSPYPVVKIYEADVPVDGFVYELLK